jgi:pimeloyl-ACP methyl ester carboxylesterase
VGGHRLHIQCSGAGTPAVIFESSLGGSSVDWCAVHPEVSRFTRAWAYDRAGAGWSVTAIRGIVDETRQ